MNGAAASLTVTRYDPADSGLVTRNTDEGRVRPEVLQLERLLPARLASQRDPPLYR